MDKLNKNNKLRESFENHLPEEQLPDFIWDNLKQELEDSSIVSPEHKTNKIQTSFQGGFEKEVLPAFLWEDILGELDAKSTVDTNELTSNKIKSSFEAKTQDKLPTYLWGNVEDQLEVETVWKKVYQALNKRTRKRYWQEKGMQISLVVLAILWVRGCDIGDDFRNQPVAYSNQTIELVEANPAKKSLINKNISPVVNSSEELNNNDSNTETDTENVIHTNNESTAGAKEVEPTGAATMASNTSQTEEAEVVDSKKEVEVTPLLVTKKDDTSDKNSLESQDKSKTTVVSATVEDKETIASQPELVAKTNTSSTISEDPTSEDDKNSKELVAEKEAKIGTTTTKTVDENKENKEVQPEVIAKNNSSTVSKEVVKEPTAVTSNKEAIATTNSNEIPSNKEIAKEEVLEPAYVKKELPQNLLPFLLGGIIEDSSIVELQDFYVENVVARKKLNIRFEVGLIGKVGTSLLLGKATDRAMDATSMLKTKVRPAGGVGVMLNCYLTPNDAIVLGAYPFSMSQQYFGGYTREGRFYHKEIKLSYFDFSLGYQRVLFHYNDFGTVPSSVYARLDYGFGYLNKGEEVINGELVEAGESYNKMNHSFGLALGNTHKIKRFVVDYGFNASIGITSVINGNSSVPVTSQSNLMRMGGYVGLRYML